MKGDATMISAQNLEKLAGLVRDIFQDESATIEENTMISDINGWDSLTHITFLSAVENEFGIELDMKDIFRLKTIGELADIIERKTL